MKLSFNTPLDYFIIFIVIVKIIFFISAIGNSALSYSISHSKSNSPTKIKINNNLLYIKERTEFLFIISMSILLLYFFNPRSSPKPYQTSEVTMLFFLFGIILIYTANWSLLFH
jgi:hypothetical protein